jgi:hypothetical protein
MYDGAHTRTRIAPMSVEQSALAGHDRVGRFRAKFRRTRRRPGMAAEPRVRAVLDALDDDTLNLLASTVARTLVVRTSLRRDDRGIARQAVAYLGAEIIFSDCRGAFLNAAGGVLRVAADYWRRGYVTPGELEELSAARSQTLHACATAVARCPAVHNHLRLIAMPHDRLHRSGEVAA